MKKTLIALAVAASAAVSGSAMAWTATGNGGTLKLSGTLTSKQFVTPWETQVGAAVDNLNGTVVKGSKVAEVSVPNSILALGIRTHEKTAFQGQPGISPNINYGGHVDLAGFNAGVTTLTLDVLNKTDSTKIGTLTAPFSVAAVGSVKGASISERYTWMYANKSYGFSGGLASDYNKAAQGNAEIILSALSPDILNNVDSQGLAFSPALSSGFSSGFGTLTATYSGAYAGGIVKGDKIKITLDAPVAGDSIAWKASLPVSVTYQ
ncbi:hypothetical protein LHP66_004509 [Salmonella enterica]|uniref:Fimbrial protein n=1 Tax=Salmonella oranienberg TaxID=28147 RepID=A0A5W8FYK6_SALON|nr:hypothetical protein [Salmonella enterica subsp. enterica serovar Oranienburg]EII5966903.1 hypothetical protein [Salmonella enterica]EBY0601673.1 hypothetical protein [Salmonella enterica subsp. enterica serovar Oranienburg]EBZ4618728.1 hypothetical protein [Salmonella enterica subsp. enterica serovar Oranienburg]EIO3777209.1 hypothetical protein [Salmonella enterica]